MPIPITTGANPEDVIISDLNQWVKTHSNVNAGKLTNVDYDPKISVYATYKFTGADAPTTLDGQPVWRCNIPPVKLPYDSTPRDIYIWVDAESKIRVEA